MLLDILEDGTGGAERFATGLACALPRERFRVSVCATHRIEGELAGQLDSAGIEHFALGRTRSTDVLPFLRLGRFLRRERVHVLHCHKFGSNVWGTIVGRLSRVPVIVAHEHTWSYEGRPFRRLLDGRLIGRFASRFVAVSSLDRERMTSVEGVPPEKTTYIPTAYMPRPEAAAPEVASRASIASSGGPVVGTVANLRPQKALDVLIDAVGKLPDAQLVIVGDGPDRPRLEEHARQRGLSERVHFTGAREDLEVVMTDFDVAAMSSDFEGMPLFIFEAMAHGIPLVATRVGGIPDVVEHGRSALLVPPRDPEQLATALAQLLGEAEYGKELAAAARDRLEQFTLEALAARFDRLYHELLREAGVPA